MKKKFHLKNLLTATNILIMILIVLYVLDKYLPFPNNYNGFSAWDNERSPALNYISGSCGGLLTNYLALGGILQNGYAIYRHITAAFLHGRLLYLITNIAGLYFIGNYAEKRFGRILTYLIFLIVAFTESFITTPLYCAIAPDKAQTTWAAVSTGASGGIFGLIGFTLAALFFDVKSFKKIGIPTIIVSAIYGVLTTYIASFGFTTVCHNVSLLIGIFLGTALILPFFLLKKGKFAPKAESFQAIENSVLKETDDIEQK